MTSKEIFIVLLSTQVLAPADALVLFAGDGIQRLSHTAKLYKQGIASRIIIISGDTRREYGSLPSSELALSLVALGVPRDIISTEETAFNTRDEAVRAIALAKECGWKSIVCISSPHHQYRAFLTLLVAMQQGGGDIRITVSPAPLSWFSDNPWGRRIDLLEGEWKRMEEYQHKGDVASFDDGIAYLKWKEENI